MEGVGGLAKGAGEGFFEGSEVGGKVGFFVGAVLGLLEEMITFVGEGVGGLEGGGLVVFASSYSDLHWDTEKHPSSSAQILNTMQ